MFIKRLQVEAEGFLAGLDIEFREGLNVIIGARGTGKTSILELLRYVLNAGGFTDHAASRGEQQAVAILEGGAATVTLQEGPLEYSITRSASGQIRAYPDFPGGVFTVLGQNELESVGAQGSGRLQLIDRFRDRRSSEASKVQSISANMRRLSVEIATAISNLSEIADGMSDMEEISALLGDAVDEQQQLLETSALTENQRARLNEVQRVSSIVGARQITLNGALHDFQEIVQQLEIASSRAGKLFDARLDPSDADFLYAESHALERAANDLGGAVSNFAGLKSLLRAALDRNAEAQHSIDQEARLLRQQLEVLQEGLGRASRRVAELTEREGQLRALRRRYADENSYLSKLTQTRDALYAELEELRDHIFATRQAIVARLNTQLAPAIRISLTKSGSVDDYLAALVAALRGSGLHYNNLAPTIAREVSPHELVKWVEDGNAPALAQVLQIPLDRSANILRHLRTVQLGDILASVVEDSVDLALLDGDEYKPSNQLSIGQRCTVVLPLLLSRHGDPLLMDQPEDHLDNAFIARTLVRSLRQRLAGDQYILTSHNANIPVLGEADRVFVMGSDGRRGFIQKAGRLDTPEITRAVSELMEGGSEAFASRARFYSVIEP